MDRNELADKHEGEVVAGNVIVKVDGKNEYITSQNSDGNWFLNELGRKLEADYEAAKKRVIDFAHKVEDEVKEDVAAVEHKIAEMLGLDEPTTAPVVESAPLPGPEIVAPVIDLNLPK